LPAGEHWRDAGLGPLSETVEISTVLLTATVWVKNMSKAQSGRSVHANATRRLFGACGRRRSLEAIGAEFGLTRQRIQQIAKGTGITWENRRRAIFGGMGKEI
jgi:hypothetical protein